MHPLRAPNLTLKSVSVWLSLCFFLCSAADWDTWKSSLNSTSGFFHEYMKALRKPTCPLNMFVALRYKKGSRREEGRAMAHHYSHHVYARLSNYFPFGLFLHRGRARMPPRENRSSFLFLGNSVLRVYLYFPS